MEPKSPSKLKLSITGWARYKRVMKFCTIVLGVVLLLMMGGYSAFKPGIGYNNVLRGSYYTVVVDCGSTGTRVNVYEWESRGVESEVLPVLMNSYPDNLNKSLFLKSSCQYHCLQTVPGLDKYVGNASGVRASLEPLILWAESLVPVERRKDTPIFVLATAGLRRLGVEDAGRILDDVEAVVKEYTFVHRKSWIRVLSGKEEAYYGWLALNYKMGSLGDSSRTPTLGLLDLGGSSLQVVVKDYETEDNEHVIKSEIGSSEHRIVAYSLPAFGLNEAFDRTVAMLNQMQTLGESTGDRIELKHPCLSSDFVQNYNCYSCVGLDINNPKNVSSQMLETAFTSTYLVGDPNWEQCKGLARAVAINSSNFDWSQLTVNRNCKASLSSFNSRSILNLTSVAHFAGRYHALSGFFVIYNNLNLSSRANLTKIWEKGQQLCSTSGAGLSNIARNQSYAAQQCFRLPYMASLIEEALCLGEAEIIFGPGDISWTLGALPNPCTFGRSSFEVKYHIRGKITDEVDSFGHKCMWEQLHLLASKDYRCLQFSTREANDLIIIKLHSVFLLLNDLIIGNYASHWLIKELSSEVETKD
ncbi:hypothetical protein Q3G72_008379 [Acer saccharum]|nr:hypothetical protein Q3G72_008379 [Acer saccharum]